jgi:hypothetical protein
MKSLLLCSLLCWYAFGKSQGSYQAGLLPAFNLNKKLPKQWSANLKIESRQSLAEGIFGANDQAEYEYLLTDFTLIAAKKVGLKHTLAGGYTLRWQGDEFVHRSIQQFFFIQNFPDFRLAHRLSTDQTFSPTDPVAFRLRYRAAMEVALAGQSVDPREFYLKINHEYLGLLQDQNFDLEVRLVPFLGYKFTDRNKLEVGLDYRVDSFIGGNGSRSRFWASVNWFLVI